MLGDGVVAGRGSEVLGGAAGAIETIGEAEARKCGGVVAAEAVCGDADLKGVAAAFEFGFDGEVAGIAEGVGVFGAKAGDLLAFDALYFLREDEELVAEFCGKACCFEIARVDEELEAIA